MGAWCLTVRRTAELPTPQSFSGDILLPSDTLPFYIASRDMEQALDTERVAAEKLKGEKLELEQRMERQVSAPVDACCRWS